MKAIIERRLGPDALGQMDVWISIYDGETLLYSNVQISGIASSLRDAIRGKLILVAAEVEAAKVLGEGEEIAL